MASVVRMDGTPWSGSEAGWRAAREQVEARVNVWQRRRAAERETARLVRAAAPLAAMLLALRAIEVGAAWALALSAVMLVALLVVHLQGRAPRTRGRRAGAGDQSERES